LKHAPIPAVSAVVSSLADRRRYQCADCRWTGWKRRLLRRPDAPATTLQPREVPQARAVWFFAAVVVFILVVGILLVRSCEVQPSDSPSGAAAQVTLDRA
jgi:hypothetical protein